jgi:murein L,D-transpeptidase YafK
MKFKRIHALVILLAVVVCLYPFRAKVRSAAVSIIQIVRAKKSVVERVAEFGDAVHGRLEARFKELGVSYPPRKIILVGLKQEKLLEVWVAGEGGQYEYLGSYPILGASGNLGPKLAEGDGQVPEGIYRIESLNPNSLYHLALRVDYPNRFDTMKGAVDGRTDLGSDIMIHGKSASIGCLAMGDQAAEDLFVMAADSGIETIQVILSPVDFRIRDLPATMAKVPPWTPELYADIRNELMKLKRSDPSTNGSQPDGSETNRTSSPEIVPRRQ